MTKEITLTRKQLYELIWSKTMREAAAELYISDVGLAKLCKRHNLPRPPQGYWLKSEQQRRLAVIPLNGSENDNQRKFHFYLLKKETLLKPPPPATGPQTLIIQRTVAKANKPFPHPAISKLVSELARDRTIPPYYYDPSANCGLRVSKKQQDRALHILNELAYRLSELGFSLEPKIDALRVRRGEVDAKVRIYEKMSYSNPNPKSSKNSTELDADRRRSDLYYIGFLALEYVDRKYSSNGTLIENKHRSLDQYYDHIIQNIIAILDDNERRRLEQLERDAQMREKEAIRAEARFRKQQEENRFTYVAELANKEIAIKRLSAFIEDYESRKIDFQYKNIHRMLRWAKGHLKLLRSQISVKQLETELNSNDLFSELYR